MSADSPAPAEEWTVRRVLEWTISHLKKHGSDSARLDAEVLLAHARGCPRIMLYTAYDEILSEAVRQKMRDLVKRRANAEPVAYLVGTKEFYSLPFEVNRDVLIPRPDTELLVMEGLSFIKSQSQPQVLDLCVGSGCVSIAMAVNHKTCRVVGVDISEPALAVARRNCERHKVTDRVELRQGDLFGPLHSGEQFDLLVSNPPYIPSGEIETLDPTVKLHEPRLALDGGNDGLDVVRRIAAKAHEVIRPGGWLLMEFTPEQSEAILGLFRSPESGFHQVSLINDLGHQPRVVKAQRRVLTSE